MGDYSSFDFGDWGGYDFTGFEGIDLNNLGTSPYIEEVQPWNSQQTFANWAQNEYNPSPSQSGFNLSGLLGNVATAAIPAALKALGTGSQKSAVPGGGQTTINRGIANPAIKSINDYISQIGSLTKNIQSPEFQAKYGKELENLEAYRQGPQKLATNAAMEVLGSKESLLPKEYKQAYELAQEYARRAKDPDALRREVAEQLGPSMGGLRDIDIEGLMEAQSQAYLKQSSDMLVGLGNMRAKAYSDWASAYSPLMTQVSKAEGPEALATMMMAYNLPQSMILDMLTKAGIPNAAAVLTQLAKGQTYTGGQPAEATTTSTLLDTAANALLPTINPKTGEASQNQLLSDILKGIQGLGTGAYEGITSFLG